MKDVKKLPEKPFEKFLDTSSYNEEALGKDYIRVIMSSLSGSDKITQFVQKDEDIQLCGKKVWRCKTAAYTKSLMRRLAALCIEAGKNSLYSLFLMSKSEYNELEESIIASSNSSDSRQVSLKRDINIAIKVMTFNHPHLKENNK